jgi:predicted transporter
MDEEHGMVKMIELLWKLGVLSAVLVFGVKIGLAMGFAGLSKKIAALITLGYGGGILLLSKLAEGYTDVLYKVIYDYNFVIFLLMAVVIAYAGFHTIKEWKKNKKNHAKASCMAMIAPCPCCFGAVITAIILVSPVIGASSFVIGKYAAVFLAITIAIFYMASDIIVRISKKPYPVLLGNFMLFVGLYFLASAIVLPNITSVMSSKMGLLTIPSATVVAEVVLVVILLMGIGVFMTRRSSSLIN